MPWGAAIAAVGAVAGASISSSGSKKAASIQSASADAATQAQLDQYNQTREDQAPYRDLATEVGLPGIRDFLANNNSQLTDAQVMAEPGYQFGLTQGNRNIQGTAAARGGLYSGATLKALQKFGNDYGTTKYNDAYNRVESGRTSQFNRLATAAGIGQTANNQVSAAGQNYANAAGSNAIGAGNAAAASTLANSNAWANALNSGISSYGRYSNSGSSSGGSIGNAGYGDYKAYYDAGGS